MFFDTNYFFEYSKQELCSVKRLMCAYVSGIPM